ncbi:secondary thiamine-phosphate synthase enzyme [Syntrophus gentianae]|uniref:Secondary thiamine-phosphate synthase enzyme n=1 Tax=Syntrophus gentianae TaxID=43775 RepID=A0A1H7VF44_9BACT|nr:secondary thiamine-phosphate synthase enzyme YjbQ [Syntrophus gentianae]SEM07468.1 secondary thiamine-phosphate synthase enzyme [Syntrophus gentianae]
MKISTETISLNTSGFCDTINLTPQVLAIVSKSKITDGLVTVFCPGSTGSVTTIEYESGALQDLKDAIERIVPSDLPYEHNHRWEDGNGFSHVRAALMKPSLTIPLVKGRPMLGTWQQIVFLDFDNRGRHREILVQIIGD